MNKILEVIQAQSFAYAREKILLAVSGGVDSVVLCDLLHKIGVKFSIAHCNYNLRGEESEKDEAFVRSLAKNYSVDFFIKHFDTLSLKKNRGSTQMLARELRYSWFKELCLQHFFTKLATAHHANDCLETTLLHLSRGTSLRGVCNMLSSDSFIIRPLLGHTKKEIQDYARANDLQWREDASNKKNEYKRNFIRHNVLPELKKLNPSLETTFMSSLERLTQTQYLWENYIEGLKKSIVQNADNILIVNIIEIQNAKWAKLALYELLVDYNFSYHQISEFIQTKHIPGKKIISKTHTLYADRDKWFVVVNGQSLGTLPSNSIRDGEDNFSDGSIHLTLKTVAAPGYTIDKRASIAALDKNLLQFPLTIRKWRSGDYFQPLGMRSRKKISDFLIDEKISAIDKERVYLVLSGKEIVWVVGRRIDDRYKVTNETRTIYEIKITPDENTWSNF